MDPISRHDADQPDQPDQPDGTEHLTPEQLDALAAQASADSDPDQPAPAGPADEPLQAHLATCAACRTALGDQVAVAAWLRNAPSAGPMPLDVITRLDTALAGAAAGRQAAVAGRGTATPGGSVGTGGPGNVLPIDRAPGRGGRLVAIAESRLTKSLVAATLVALIAVGGYTALNHHNSSDRSTASAGAASSAAQPVPQGAKVVRVQHSGTAYTTANIAAQVTAELAHHDAAATAGGLTPAEDGSSTLTTPAGLQACLASLGAPTATPLLVDLATYAGRPAAVLVLREASGAREIWVVSPTCAGDGKDGTRYFAPLS